MDKEFLSVREIAEMLGLKEDTIQGWIRSGSLPAIKLGNTYRVKRRDLDTFLDQRRTNRDTKDS